MIPYSSYFLSVAFAKSVDKIGPNNRKDLLEGTYVQDDNFNTSKSGRHLMVKYKTFNLSKIMIKFLNNNVR